ncbi:NRPS-like enzyme [Aspergillus luchuensis]|uniref:NRPS-like enzyme n=1 Tax=Aspergillus kawachii TaxID=1069201 RepID=A0A146EYU4_ASPKA|nr:NRPS-like enzyme [Aspergillus luchuensis]
MTTRSPHWINFPPSDHQHPWILVDFAWNSGLLRAHLIANKQRWKVTRLPPRALIANPTLDNSLTQMAEVGRKNAAVVPRVQPIFA